MGLGIAMDRLADTIGFEILPNALARDIRIALRSSLRGGAVFAEGSRPITILRAEIDAAIRDIRTHPRGILIQNFLKLGPYTQDGPVPEESAGEYLSDSDTAMAIRFIFSFMVSRFQGALAEMLASKTCLELMKQLQDKGRIANNTRLLVGDVVTARQQKSRRFAKGADIHMLAEEYDGSGELSVTVAGIAEVKSYMASWEQINRQTEKHIKRLRGGIRIAQRMISGKAIKIGSARDCKVITVAVVPAMWKLPRSFGFQTAGGKRILNIDPGVPENNNDVIHEVEPGRFRVTLRWSKEALASAAYDFTFWYMGKIGEVIYSDSMPPEWLGMSPAEAGRNATKMALYYSVLRSRTEHEFQRAVALYNIYGFGYALGSNFKDDSGRREMLWPEDLEEIAKMGQTSHGYRIVGATRRETKKTRASQS